MMPAIVSAETPAPDRVLVSQAQDGEREALEELAKKFRRPAYLLALQLTGRPEMAQDVAQDAMLRFFQHIDRVDLKINMLNTRPIRGEQCDPVVHRVKGKESGVADPIIRANIKIGGPEFLVAPRVGSP